jgi:hypothetical protein
MDLEELGGDAEESGVLSCGVWPRCPNGVSMIANCVRPGGNSFKEMAMHKEIGKSVDSNQST